MRQIEMFGSCRKLVRSGIAQGAVVLLFLALQTLAASPELHHALHQDSNHPNHHCVVKLFSQGQLDIVPSIVSVPTPDVICVEPPALQMVLPVAPSFEFPPGRAPPFLLP